jgi:hypothetical protein
MTRRVMNKSWDGTNGGFFILFYLLQALFGSTQEYDGHRLSFLGKTVVLHEVVPVRLDSFRCVNKRQTRNQMTICI